MPRGFQLLPVLIVLLLFGLSGAADSAEIRSINAEITIPGWWVVGPFMAGVREAGTDGLAFDRDAAQFSTPLLRPSYPSALVPGGDARWRWYDSDENGNLSVDYPEVPAASMELVTDEWGFAGGYTVGYAYATLHVTDGPRRALMDLRQASGLSINGVPWPGDPYGHGMGLTPVLLDDGDNELKVGIGSGQSFSLKLLPVTDDLVAFKQSATLPDIVRGDAPPQYFGLPLANTTTEWLTLEEVSIEPAEIFGGPVAVDATIAPLCIYNLPITCIPAQAAIPTDLEGDTLAVTIRVKYAGGETSADVALDVRDPDEARRVTFISDMDLSVQYYGLLLPSDFDPDREYGLILSLHGAGVEAIGQASSYQPKDWAYVVAPTNRRRFGFDWQDWGQQDMLEVLANAQANNHIDENRIHLTGHSMGGHGTWLNALTFPDKWATAAPSAGWSRFDLYAPMFLRKNLLYGEPKANYIWALAMRGDDTLALAENALNLPFYALEGGADDNVPPQQPRLMYERLTRLGYDITYEEIPGMGHWWDLPDTPGTDCVDSAALNEFWETHVRDSWPKKVVFKTGNYSINSGAYWVKGVPERAHEDMVIRAEVAEGRQVAIHTVNVSMLMVKLATDLLGSGDVTIDIDDKVFVSKDLGLEVPGWTIFQKTPAGNWDVRNYFTDELVKDYFAGRITNQEWTGPWKGILNQPCGVIADESSDDEVDKWTLHIARLYAYHWWYRANGCLPVITRYNPACSMTSEQLKELSVIRKNSIFITGSATEWEELLQYFDTGIYWNGESITIGGKRIPPKSVSYKGIHPRHSDNSITLIEGGTSIEALKRLPAMMGIYSGAGMPDWMVWDDEVQLKGLGGVIAMGFYDLDWQIDEDLSYFNEDLINRLE